METLSRSSADRDAEFARSHRENDTLARAFGEHVRRVVGDADELLTNLKLEYEKAGRVTGEMAALIERSKGDPSLNQIAVTDARGTLSLSAVPLDRPINISQNETYKTLSTRADGGLLIARPIKTQASGTWSFFVARRLNARDGRFAGIATAGLNPDYFSRFYEELGLDPDRAVLLMGRDGIVRARRFQKQTEVGQDLSGSPMFKRMEREPRRRRLPDPRSHGLRDTEARLDEPAIRAEVQRRVSSYLPTGTETCSAAPTIRSCW